MNWAQMLGNDRKRYSGEYEFWTWVKAILKIKNIGEISVE